MLDTSFLSTVARQLMTSQAVEIEAERLPVRCTSKQGLRAVTFTMRGTRI